MRDLYNTHLENHSDALVHGVSVQHLAFQGGSVQSRHEKCAQKKRRPGKPVWILGGLAPAAQPCQEEPVSTKHPRWFLNTTTSHHLRCFLCRLLVGAPRAKHRNQVNVTGVVYQCDLATTSERCEPIEFDNKGLLLELWANFACYVNTQRGGLLVYHISNKYILGILQHCYH